MEISQQTNHHESRLDPIKYHEISQQNPHHGRGRSQAGVDVVAAMVRSESGWCEPPVDLASGNFLQDEASIMYKWTVQYKASPQWS